MFRKKKGGLNVLGIPTTRWDSDKNLIFFFLFIVFVIQTRQDMTFECNNREDGTGKARIMRSGGAPEVVPAALVMSNHVILSRLDTY